MSIIRNAQINIKLYETTKVELFTRKGIQLFSSGAGELFVNVSDQPFFSKLNGLSGCFRDAAAHPIQMITYAGSEGIESFRGLGWILALEHDEAEILAKSHVMQNQDGREFIDYAVDGARRMKVMISDLLIYSRVGTKGKPFAPTDTMKVMQDVLNDLELTIQDNDARITFDSLPVVTADESQLQQLFRNLISNAVKYRGQDPPQIHVSAQRQKRAWRFSVQDNDIGIEARFFERIFQIFQRLHGPGRYNGTGIGLAICKKIVERHGGSFDVESTPGQGSTFYFTISDLKEN